MGSVALPGLQATNRSRYYNLRMKPVGTTRISFLHRLQDRADQRSWGEFHERYGELLYRYAQGRGATHSDAEEVVQEVEMYVFKAMDRFSYDARKGRFRSYLRASVIHALGRRSAKRSRQEVALDPHMLESLAQDSNEVDEEWEREWRRQRLRSALRSIAGEVEPITLEAFRIYALEDQPAAEVAKQLGISTDTVWQAKSRVLKRLRERVAAMPDDDDDWG